MILNAENVKFIKGWYVYA